MGRWVNFQRQFFGLPGQISVTFTLGILCSVLDAKSAEPLSSTGTIYLELCDAP
jgi:hypothetical protein